MSTRSTTMIQPSSKSAPPYFTNETVVGASGLSLTPRLTFDALRKYGPSAQQPTPSAAVLQSSSTNIVSSSSRWEGAGRVAPLRALVRKQSATYGDNNIGELVDEPVAVSSAMVAVYDAPAQKMRPSVMQHRVDPFALVTTSVAAPSEMDDTTSSLPDLDDWSQQAASGAVHSSSLAERGRITTQPPQQPLHAVHLAPALAVRGNVNSTIQQQLSSHLPMHHQKLRSQKLHYSSLLNESDALDVTLSEASLNSSLRSNSSLHQDQYYTKTNKNAPEGVFTTSHPHHHNSSSPPMTTHYAPPSPSLAKAAQQRQEALGHIDFPRRSMEGVLHQSSPQWTTSSARTHPSQLSHALSQSQQQRDDMSPLQQTSHQYSVVVAGTPSRVPQHQPHPSPSRDYMSSSMVLSSSLNVSSPYNSSTWTAAHHGSGERRAPPQYYDGPDVQSQQRMLHNAPPPPPPSLAAVVASSPSSSYQSPSQYYNAANTHRLHHDGHAYELPHQQTMATPTGAASRYLPNITVDPPSSPRGSPRRRIAPNRSPGSGISDILTPGGGRGKSNSQQRQSNEFLSPMRRPSDMMHSAERNRRILQRHLFSGDDD
ncbi:Hypothetical protein, putative [Bodo saltans]|uniref:Uncharacterized protein n=1 Tax=Bodo saltans TaxID=75058 RepID=A0A0S4J529_BODSA|nr:Hypothetical protein, putative [Bodo saltans]|eukprot:CUG84486.1 Hypothetical protein, putative [Bodo saltans]